MNFQEWFTDWCADPVNSASVAHLYTERQYFLLLRVVACAGMRVSDMDCTREEKRWLYHKLGTHTYRAVTMSYGTARQVKQVGQVLVWQAGKPSHPGAPITVDALRRVIPLPQIVSAIQYCHAETTGHRGQDATVHALQQLFEGVSRFLVREAVKRCAVCQTKSAKQFKARLQPIVSPHLFDRMLIDLIDKRRQPDQGYHYIMHLADHNSRLHFVRPLKDKQASSVAEELASVFAITGGCRVLQSDRGPEFRGEVESLCESFGIQQVRSSPCTPSTSGLIEKYNHVIKVAISAWQAENNTHAWVACLPRLALQMNTTWSRAIRCTPYELVFGHVHRTWCQPVLSSTQLNYLEEQEWVEDPANPDAPLQPPPALAALYRVPSASPPSSQPPPPPPSSTAGTARRPRAPLADEDVQDCAFGAAGELGRLCSAKLNVGGLHFRRCGCIGRGRCAVCAVELAMRDCQWVQSEAEMEVYCDDQRLQYRDHLRFGTPAQKKLWLQQMVDVGGGDSPVGKLTESQVQAAAERTVLRDLADPRCNLGWEVLVLAAAYHRVNILLFPVVVITGQPIEAIDQRLIPHQWNDQLPVIVIYHRAFYMADGDLSDGSVDAGGHYETIFCVDRDTGAWLSRFEPGHPTWTHLRRLAGEVMARSAATVARAQMEDDYNLNVAAADFAVGAAVGVRTNATKQRTQKRGVINIPALVVAVRDNVRVGAAATGQRVYTCLCKYGIIDRELKVDWLVYLSANNHLLLFESLRQHLADDTWRLQPRVTVEAAVKAFLSEREAGSAVAPPRQQPWRAAAAGGSECELSEADEEGDEEQQSQHAASPFTLTLSQAQQHPIRIVRRSGQRYLVEWNDPPDERTWERVNVWDNRAEYRELVLAFREEERLRGER